MLYLYSSLPQSLPIPHEPVSLALWCVPPRLLCSLYVDDMDSVLYHAIRRLLLRALISDSTMRER